MMTSFQIATLRKQNRLTEAYNAVREALTIDCGNVEFMRLLGFILTDQLKALTTTNSTDFFGL